MVSLSTKSTEARASQNQALLNYGFRFFVTQLLYTANEALARTRVWKGQEKMLPLGLTDDLYITVPRRYLSALQAKTEVPGKIMAPVRQGDALGTLAILLGEQIYRTEALTALEVVNNAISNVTATRGKVGAVQNRLQRSVSALSITSENLQAAESAIRDADIAEEIATLTRNQILVQTSTAMVGQSNLIPQSVLQLLA